MGVNFSLNIVALTGKARRLQPIGELAMEIKHLLLVKEKANELRFRRSYYGAITPAQTLPHRRGRAFLVSPDRMSRRIVTAIERHHTNGNSEPSCSPRRSCRFL